MGQMVLMTEYRTKPGKRNELFELFDRLLAHDRVIGQDFLVWSTSTTDRDASFLFEYWSDADGFADLVNDPRFVEYISGVDQLVKTRPVTTVSVPHLVDGVRVHSSDEPY
jgi:quinol monooxygenase YgiN